MRVLLEGVDGAGKTTVAKMLDWGRRFVFPDRSTATGVAIDKYLRAPPFCREVNPFLFQCLHFANHLEAMSELREAHKATIDRYWPSGVVYGGFDGLDRDWLITCGEGLAVQPDLFVLLDVGPDLAKNRLIVSGKRPEAYDGEEALSRVVEAYRKLWLEKIDAMHKSTRADGGADPRWVIVDANVEIEDVLSQVRKLIEGT